MVPLQHIEAYVRQLVANTRQNLSRLSHATNHHDYDMKLATWNIHGAQGKLRMQRWANITQLIRDCRIHLIGI